MDDRTSYRPDIQGLRAVAVLAIVFDHFDLGAPGGFVGVDIFFVISGYLITRIIGGMVASNAAFPFAEFYGRRVLRIYPALVFTIAAAFVAAYVLLPPELLMSQSLAAIYSLFGLSNFYFFADIDYFRPDAIRKPLLHLWSLAVELQFYLLWPLLLVPLLSRGRKTWTMFAIVVLAVASFAAAQAMQRYSAPAAFYLFPFRAGEFLIGASLVWLPSLDQRPRAATLLSCTGIAALALVIVLYDNHTPFPGVTSLVPCLATAMVMAAGPRSLANRLLSTRPLTAIGAISYSLYLSHWPLLSFFTSYKLGDVTLVERLALIAVSILCANAMYFVIERPFRYRRPAPGETPNAWKMRALGLAGAVLILGSVNAYANFGWTWRFAPPVSEIFLSNVGNGEAARNGLIRLDRCYLSTNFRTFEKYSAAFSECNALQEPAIAVIGDSHAGDVFMGLSQIRPDLNLVQLTGGNCNIVSEGNCREMMDFALEYLAANRSRIRAVIYVVNGKALWSWSRSHPLHVRIKATRDYLRKIADLSVPTIWLGPRFEYDKNVPDMLASSHDREEFERQAKASQTPRIVKVDRTIAGILKQEPVSGLSYISTYELLCPAGSCPVFDRNLNVLVSDDEHWTPAGARLFAWRLIEKSDVLGRVFAATPK
jgi:peptidoglycan/LPS O-acetylase OafA/YrhL